MSRLGLVLAGLVLLAPGLARADAPGDERGGVAIYRGSEGTRPSAVPIYRGSAAMGYPGPVPVRARPPEPETVAGKRLWLVDPATGRLTACQLENTADYGRERIRCTERDLP